MGKEKKDESDSLRLVGVAVLESNEESIEIEVSLAPGWAEKLGMTEEELTERISRDAIQQILSEMCEDEAEKVRSKSTVGYSRAYANNWSNVFGKKENKELPN